MKKLLLATGNPGKLQEMRQGLSGLMEVGFQLLSLSDLDITVEPKETGTTFKENAELKARYYANLAQIPTLADDGGFVIPYLNGEPGVHSARWLGENSDEEALINHTLRKLEKAKGQERYAYLQLVLCFLDPISGNLLFESEKIDGRVADKSCERRINGFPYRALLKVFPFKKYYDDLSLEEHVQVNHRLKALKKLEIKLKQIYE